MADLATPIDVVIEDEDQNVRVDPVTGTIETDQPDGGVVVNLDAHRPEKAGANKDFYRNLVDDIDHVELGRIANDLFDAISADDRSRSESIQNAARGLDILGIKLQEPRSGVGDSAGAVEGMSTVTNPLLLEAVLKGWANAQAELLPASGPVKIRDDGDETAGETQLAERLQKDMNHYFTKVLPDYYPDTSHMLLWGVYFKGAGFKKVYRCPMRRRPVSVSVDSKDLIVSDTTKDLRACARITHQIPMRPSVMKRMILIDAYRDVTLTQPTPQPNAVDQTVAEIQGTQATSQRPEDQPYTLWESQCELDLAKFAPGKFKDEGIPLPYLVTMDKDSREILAIRRDWNEDDEECERKRLFVKYPYIPGPGFYGTGMLNILGNSSSAMTAAWREALDAGMFASFPGGLIRKDGARQNSSMFRVSPGQFEPVETGGKPIQDMIMPMPYRDVTAGLLGMIDKITAQSKSLAGAAEIPAGEGIQDVPVGSMLAQIEQATKIIAAAHKGMHQAQSEEIDLIVDLLRDNPEDFWRGNRICPKDYWHAEKFEQALNDCNLVPVSDPNVPSHLHRLATALGLIQLKMNPILGPKLDDDEVLHRVLAAMRVDPQGLVLPPQPVAPPQPALADVAKMKEAEAKVAKVQVEAAKAATEHQDNMAELEARKEIKTAEIAKALIIHQDDAADARRAGERTHGLGLASHGLSVAKAANEAALKTEQALNPPAPKSPR